MKKSVRIRKQGKFYNVYEEDAYVIHALLGYRVSNGRVGFPINAIGKVSNELENAKINFVIIEQDEEINKKTFSINNYNKFYKKGIESTEKRHNFDELVDKINKISNDKLIKIIDYINEVIDE